MKIKISTRIRRVYVVRGRYFLDHLYQPVIQDRNARCSFHISITDCNQKGDLVVQPSLAYGPELKSQNMGSSIKISLDKGEHDFDWTFIPYESGPNQIRLYIKNLGQNNTVFDDYNSLVINKIYGKSFMVRTFFEYIVLWFAGISTLGAIAEILNFLILAKILQV